MSYKNLEEFSLPTPQDFESIFYDNGITYSGNSISKSMLDFLNGKKIIFEESFFSISLDRENIRNIFNIQEIKKEAVGDNIFTFLKGNYSETKISNFKFKNEKINLIQNTYFNDCDFNNLDIKSNNKEIILNFTGGDINVLFLNEISHIHSIGFYGVNNINDLYIQDLDSIKSLIINVKYIGDINMNQCFFEGKQFTFNINEIQSAIFKNCNFGETQFNGIKFLNFGFLHTTFNECKFNNLYFPNKLLNKINDYTISNIEMKDNYRQLKYVMEKNGNNTEANKFFALEMEYYSKTPNLSLYEKFSLGIQKFINNFGGNWFRNFIIILVFTLLSTIVNYLYLELHYNLIDFNFIKTYFNLISPFYGLSKELNLDLPLYGGFILYKIIYGTLIYQLIIALKRTTKR